MYVVYVCLDLSQKTNTPVLLRLIIHVYMQAGQPTLEVLLPTLQKTRMKRCVVHAGTSCTLYYTFCKFVYSYGQLRELGREGGTVDRVHLECCVYTV